MAGLGQLREYETIYIIRPELDDKEAKEAMLSNKETIEKLGGKNIKVTAMGRRRLAWERNKETRGIFVHHRFVGSPGIVKDFDRALSINEKILLRQSIVLNHHVDGDLIKVEEDSLVPPIIKERREFDKRRGFDRGEFGRGRDDGDMGGDDHYFDEEDD